MCNAIRLLDGPTYRVFVVRDEGIGHRILPFGCVVVGPLENSVPLKTSSANKIISLETPFYLPTKLMHEDAAARTFEEILKKSILQGDKQSTYVCELFGTRAEIRARKEQLDMDAGLPGYRKLGLLAVA